MQFKEFGLLTAFFAMHDANRGEKIDISVLSRRWVTFWMASAMDAGSATVSSPAYEEDVEVWFYERPFAQPLSNIRDYFGEKVCVAVVAAHLHPPTPLLRLVTLTHGLRGLLLLVRRSRCTTRGWGTTATC